MIVEIVDYQWKGRALEFRVHWADGDITWVPLTNVARTAALDDFLDLHGMPREAPRCLLRRTSNLVPDDADDHPGEAPEASPPPVGPEAPDPEPTKKRRRGRPAKKKT